MAAKAACICGRHLPPSGTRTTFSMEGLTIITGITPRLLSVPRRSLQRQHEEPRPVSDQGAARARHGPRFHPEALYCSWCRVAIHERAQVIDAQGRGTRAE